MALYSNNLTDKRNGRAIVGAKVWVYTSQGIQATLTDALDQPIAQPLITDQDGAYSFKTTDGIYQIDFWKDTVEIFSEKYVQVGTGPVLPAEIVASLSGNSAAGLIGTTSGASVQASLNTLQAADAALATGAGAAGIGNVLPAGTNLRTQTLAEFTQTNPLQITQFSGASEEAQLLNALVEGNQTRDGGQGHTVLIPRGEIQTTAPFNIPNRVTISGVNKRGSRIKAASGFVGSYMATVVNGTSSMFDNPLKDLTIDCNDVAGLGGVDSSAWQEGGGLRNVLVQKFRTIGINIRDGFGGAALLPIDNAEIFASSTAVATAGIKLNQISSVGNFVLSVKNCTIAGTAAFPLPRGIDIVKDSTNLETIHFEDTVTGVYIDGLGDHVLENVTGGPGVTNVVRIASTFAGTLTMRGCRRAGATNLVQDDRTNGLGTVAWDTDVDINVEPPMGPVAIARGTFNGTGTPALTYVRGCASITRTSAGLYAVTLSRALVNTNMIIPMVTARAGANVLAGPDITLTGANSFTIQLRSVAGTAVDSDEIKFAVFGF